ncbi:FAD-dependent oxidoreductase [candidate division KSB1 bacterium]
MSETQPGAWICSVCGYVHQGAEPPDYCPVCGAAKDLFEPYTEAAPSGKTTAMTQWRCLNCEYIHDGAKPPEYCPVCGASADKFEPYMEESGVSSHADSMKKIVIVGAGIAGVSAAEAVRKTSPQAEIVLLSKEEHLPYYRLNLTRYLAGDIGADELELHSREWYTGKKIDLLLEKELLSLDPEKKIVTVQDGSQYTYDKLILTVGSHPFVPSFPGANKENVTVLRTRQHADAILNLCREGMRCVCIGGGLLGLETAGALVKRGVDVTLLEGHGWLLPRQLNQKSGELLETFVNSTGISLKKNARTQELVGDEQVRGVLLQDGTTIPADIVVITTGVRSNSYLARLAKLKVNQGIVVDGKLTTSNPDVFAAGDVAEFSGTIYGLWGPSQFQGTIAGMNAAGEDIEFAGIPRSNMLKVLGYDLFSIGQILTEDASYEIVEDKIDENYFYFVFRDSFMVGSILMGDTTLSAAVKKIIEKHHDCSKILQQTPDLKKILNFLSEFEAQ